MKLIENAKTDFLLEASLDILHEQSREWLENIEFYKNEINFLYTLLVKKASQVPAPQNTGEGKSIRNYLINVDYEKLNSLKQEVLQHEKYLAKMLNHPHQNEEVYRSKHKVLVQKMDAFEKELKEVKQKIFQVVKRTAPKLKVVSIK